MDEQLHRRMAGNQSGPHDLLLFREASCFLIMILLYDLLNDYISRNKSI